ncbi:hypothetical protein CR513_12377, partial [Mucuna pruriens]
MDNAKGLPFLVVTNIKLSKHGIYLFLELSFYCFTVGALQNAQSLTLRLATRNPYPLLDSQMQTGGSDLDDRKSTSSSFIFLGPNLVSWWSKMQTLVAWSNTEAGSLANTTSEVIQKTAVVKHVPTLDQIANIFTKALSPLRFQLTPDLFASGVFRLATQTTVKGDTFVYHIAKYRLVEFPGLKKPTSIIPLAETKSFTIGLFTVLFDILDDQIVVFVPLRITRTPSLLSLKTPKLFLRGVPRLATHTTKPTSNVPFSETKLSPSRINSFTAKLSNEVQ